MTMMWTMVMTDRHGGNGDHDDDDANNDPAHALSMPTCCEEIEGVTNDDDGDGDDGEGESR